MRKVETDTCRRDKRVKSARVVVVVRVSDVLQEREYDMRRMRECVRYRDEDEMRCCKRWKVD